MMDIDAVIDAFADGEPVDPGALDAALAQHDGRARLIDLLVLRGFVNGPGLTPLAAPAPSMRVTHSWRWMSIAALVAIAASVGGYVAGSRAAGAAGAPGAAGALGALGATGALGAPGAMGAAPAPTRVIRFEPGVDWTEHVGGH